MIFDQEFEEVGIKRVQDCVRDEEVCYKYIYEYSDFETLTFVAKDWDCADGSKAVEIENFSIQDFINFNTHICINYPMYFRNVDDFFQLLKLIGYKIRAL